MAVSPGFRIGAIALLAALAVTLGLVLLSGSSGKADAAKRLPGQNQTRYLLRLTDLPPGFTVFPIGSVGAEGRAPGPHRPCGKLDPAEPEPKLAAFLREYRPAGCFAAYMRLYRTPVPGPHPFLAGSGALDAGSVEGAREAFALAPQILSHFVFEGEVPQSLPSPTAVGEETMLLPWPDAGFFRREESGTFAVWRSGTVVGVTLALGGSIAADQRDALELARLQQAHIEHPTPYLPSEADASEVALDDPRLKRPVYWLGSTLAPHGLPKLRLADSSSRPGAKPANQLVRLSYRHGVRAESWSEVGVEEVGRERWKRRGPIAFPPSACAEKRAVNLLRGRAVVYHSRGGQVRECAGWPPNKFMAQAFLGKIVVTVTNQKVCATCTGERAGAYDSFNGMETVLRALELRPKPVY